MKEPTRAPFFACLYPSLCAIARENGYALAIHGTVTNDLDLVAVPWTETAVPAEELVERLKKHISAVDYHGLLTRQCDWATPEQVRQMVEADHARNAEPRGEFDCVLKPHGRKAWNLYLEYGARVDLSVMPRNDTP
jgi:hypothetical protein